MLSVGVFTLFWNVIRTWLDERISSKVCIAGDDFKVRLLNRCVFVKQYILLSLQEALCQHIAPENLPAFLGGKCRCDHIEGGCCPVPKTCHPDYSLYEQEVTVSARDMFKLDVHAEKADGVLYWNWKTVGYNISFGVMYHASNGQPSL